MTSRSKQITTVAIEQQQSCIQSEQNTSRMNLVLVLREMHVLLFILIRHPRCSPFKALRVLLVFEEPAELWSELLMMSGASSVRQHQAEKDSSGTYNT